MAAWRRKALALFPQLKDRLQGHEGYYSIYFLFADLRALAKEAHENRDGAQLRKVYGFAEWCAHAKSKDLWNPADVSFYEHLVDDDQSHWVDFVSWISPEVRDDVSGLWEWVLKDRPGAYQYLMRLFQASTPKHYLHDVFHSGAIKGL
jgi:hypothetical protein